MSFNKQKLKRLGENTIIVGEFMFIFDKRKSDNPLYP